MDLDAFVTEHSAEWHRLQTLLRRRRRRLSGAEVDELVMLYRRTATHLSMVSSRSPDPALVAWLSRLVLQARASVSPSAGFSWATVRRFFTVTFPLETYRAGRWWAAVAAGFVAVSWVLIMLFASDESRVEAFLSPQEVQRLVSNDFEAYYSSYAPQNFAFAVWTNNAWLSALCLASGVLILPVLYLLWENAFNVGLIGGVMIGHGRADVFFGLILVHGLLELTCVFIAAGAGLRIAWAWIAPGPRRTRGQALAQTARSAMVVALGLVPTLLISGCIEAFVTPSPLPIPLKLALGALVWAGFLSYVIGLGARAAGAGETADVDSLDRPAVAPAT